MIDVCQSEDVQQGEMEREGTDGSQGQVARRAGVRRRQVRVHGLAALASPSRLPQSRLLTNDDDVDACHQLCAVFFYTQSPWL
jgi:hypothetical protein